jgi:23S rRNA pseudouridine2604 synthase
MASRRSPQYRRFQNDVGDSARNLVVVGIIVFLGSFILSNHDRIVDGFAIGLPIYPMNIHSASLAAGTLPYDEPRHIRLNRFRMVKYSDRSDPPKKTPELPKNDPSPESSTQGIRLNKVFTHQYSRRAADQLIQAGRVKVNGAVVADMGRRVMPYQDVVHLDDHLYTDWEMHCDVVLPPLRSEATAEMIPLDSNNVSAYNPHVYIKYWKPVGVISTTDRTVPDNLIDAMYDVTVQRRYDQRHRKILLERRIFNVGRLDKDSSGLLLLTSDGRIPNVVLSKHYNHSKVYYVRIDRPISQAHLQHLRDGIVITTDTVRQGKHRAWTARTLPCTIEPLYSPPLPPNSTTATPAATSSSSSFRPTTELQITLTEGRNRQIRVMLQTVGRYAVLELHRLQFMGQQQIDLSNLQQPGDWTLLSVAEVSALQEALHQSRTSTGVPVDDD